LLTFTAYEPPNFQTITQEPEVYSPSPKLGLKDKAKTALYGLGTSAFLLLFIFAALNKDRIVSFTEPASISPASTEEITPATADPAVPPNNAAGTAPPGFNKNNLFQPALGQ
jgi:hypothetical protein